MGAAGGRKPVHRERPETKEKREKIIRAATEVFGQKGSSNGTLEEIADKVGMTRAGVLHHFGSKDNLLLQTVIHRDRDDVEEYPSEHMPGGTDAFRHLVKTARLNAKRPGIVRAFVTLSAESTTEGNPGHEYFVQRYANLRKELAEALMVMALARDLELDRDDAFQASAEILAVMDGLQLQWVLEPGCIDLAEATERAIGNVLKTVFGKEIDLT